MPNIDMSRYKPIMAAAKERGYEVRDVGVEDLELASALYGDADVIAVECGADTLAWFVLYQMWTLVAVTPKIDRMAMTRTEWYKGPWPSEWVLDGTKGDKKRGSQLVVTEDEPWIAARLPNKSIQLAYVLTRTDSGKPELIRLDPNDVKGVPFDTVPLRWFVVKDRDQACAFLFHTKRLNMFPNYLNFVQRLGRAQKDILKGVYVKSPGKFKAHIADKPAPIIAATPAATPRKRAEPIKEVVSPEEEREAIFVHPNNRTERQHAIVAAYLARPNPPYAEPKREPSHFEDEENEDFEN